MVRTDYSLNATDAGVTDKVYLLYRCDVLSDSIAALEARLAVLQGATPPPPPPPPSPSSFTCGTSTVTYDGHAYSTVLIGSQCWFAENLRNDNYADGTAIPGGLDAATWGSTTAGAFTIYDEGGANEATNLATYGRLYNWYAVTDGAGLCPTGWHVPTDAEWTTLETQLGGASVAGGKMKSVSWDGDNTSGFSGLPAGGRYSDGYFYLLGDDGYWWSSSPDGGLAIYRYLNSGLSSVFRNSSNPRNGFSVRCLQD